MFTWLPGDPDWQESSQQEELELHNIFYSKPNAIGSTCLSEYPILRNLSLYSPK